MKVGDKVKVSLRWKFGFKPVKKTGIIKEIYSNGMCKVNVSLEHGGYRTVIGNIKDCVPID